MKIMFENKDGSATEYDGVSLIRNEKDAILLMQDPDGSGAKASWVRIPKGHARTPVKGAVMA